MTVSREEALRFLNKLANSSSVVIAVLGTPFGAFSFECCIVEVTEWIVRLEQRIEFNVGHQTAPVPSRFSLASATGFAYGDGREASTEDQPTFQNPPFGPVTGALTVYFSNTESLILIEREQ